MHKSAHVALKAYPALVKTAREKLQQDQQVYASFIESWKTSCVNSVEAHKLFDWRCADSSATEPPGDIGLQQD